VVKDGETNTTIRDLQTLFEVGTVGALSDGQLLDRFVARREEAVFEAFIHRHGPMVWGVCRRVLRDHHDAEDAFQATFLVLARKAASVNPREKVGNWLYGVAYQAAMKARATRAKRRARERQVSEMPEPGAVREEQPDDLLPQLDRELSRLPDKYRVPIVLCDLQEKTHQEAASQLGWPIGTVSGRLSRARAMLAQRLARRGLVLSGGSLGVLLAQDAASASVPTKLIGPTAQAANLFAAGRAVTAVVPAVVAALTGKVLNTMLLSKLKIVTAFLVVGLALAAGGTSLAYRAQAAGGPSQERPDERTKGRNHRPEEPQPEADKSQITLVMAQDKPVDPMASYPFRTDSDDVYEFPGLTVEYRDLHLSFPPVNGVGFPAELKQRVRQF
jgi:RNA polymerase sigma-70 factor (ECF subfamily)